MGLYILYGIYSMLPADGPLCTCMYVVFVYTICEIFDMQCLIRTSLKGRRLLCLVYMWSLCALCICEIFDKQLFN